MSKELNIEFYEKIRPHLTYLTSSTTKMKFFAYKLDRKEISEEILKSSIKKVIAYIRQGGVEGRLTKELSQYQFETIGEFTTKSHMEKYVEGNGWTIIRPIHGEESVSYIEMAMLLSSIFDTENEQEKNESLKYYKKECKRIQKIRGMI